MAGSSLYCWEVLTLAYPNPPSLGKMSGRQLAQLAVVSIMGISIPWDPHPMTQQIRLTGALPQHTGLAWHGRAGSSMCHTMHPACPCLFLQDPALSRRIFSRLSGAQESHAQALQPLGRESFAPDHKAMAKEAGTAEPVW